jgi:integrase
MATLGSDHGRYFLQWRDAKRGPKRTLSLGRIPAKRANKARGHLDEILQARRWGHHPPAETIAWLTALDNDTHARFAAAGLVKPRNAKPLNELESFLDRYIAARTDLKPRSASILGQVKRHLVIHFTATQAIEHITRADAKAYRRYLVGALSPATVSMHVLRSRQMFQEAVDAKLIAENPFDGLVAGPQTNDARLVYVTKATVWKVIGACPSIDWKLMFALPRFAGLRTPSESCGLRWADVLWDQRRMVVHSPKTERHAGKDQRIVPIAPELMPLLEQAWESAPEGAVHVVNRRRGENPRTTALKLIARSGVTPWPKPFQNLRASCETDWCDELPVLAACAMIGNSAVVARKHYVSVKDEHFDRITGSGAATGAAQLAPTEAKLTRVEAQKLDSDAEKALNKHPRQGPNSPVVLLENLVVTRKALQKALQTATASMSKALLRDLAQLEDDIAAARRHAEGGNRA